MVDRDGEPLETVVKEFTAFIGDLPLVSYGADFDMRFLRDVSKRHNIALNNRVTCALKLARKAWPELSSHGLSDVISDDAFSKLCQNQHLSDEGTHRALGDCKRTMFVYTAAAVRLGFAGVK